MKRRSASGARAPADMSAISLKSFAARPLPPMKAR
jgi:hypothetical protein